LGATGSYNFSSNFGPGPTGFSGASAYGTFSYNMVDVSPGTVLGFTGATMNSMVSFNSGSSSVVLLNAMIGITGARDGDGFVTFQFRGGETGVAGQLIQEWTYQYHGINSSNIPNKMSFFMSSPFGTTPNKIYNVYVAGFNSGSDTDDRTSVQKVFHYVTR
jgi:hypothetical protein